MLYLFGASALRAKHGVLCQREKRFVPFGVVLGSLEVRGLRVAAQPRKEFTEVYSTMLEAYVALEKAVQRGSAVSSSSSSNGTTDDSSSSSSMPDAVNGKRSADDSSSAAANGQQVCSARGRDDTFICMLVTAQSRGQCDPAFPCIGLRANVTQ